MKVMVNGNGNVQEWSLIDPATKVDWVSDLVGNHNGFDNMEEVDHEEYGTVFVTDKENADWWTNVIDMKQRIDNLSYELEQVMDKEKLQSALEDASQADLDDQYKGQLSIVEELAKEHHLL